MTETRKFYDTIESVYNFFGHITVRWQKLQNVHDRSCSNPTSKTLNSTRRSGRYDAVYALKERFCDVMKCLSHIILTSTKERDEAMAIKKQIENFDFFIRDVEAEAEPGSGPFSVEAEARKIYRFRFHIGFLTSRVAKRKSFVSFPMWIKR